MRTVTVRDLRNRFADVSKWIEEGETVMITKRGINFATISPTLTLTPATKPKSVNWAERLARVPAVGRRLTKEETEALWREVRG